MTEFPKHEIEWEAHEHASPEMLAALVDGTLKPQVSKEVELHLRHCRRCFATYGELARMQASTGTGFGLKTAPPAWMAEAKAIARPVPPPRSGFPRSLAAIALVAAVLGFALVPMLTRESAFVMPGPIAEQLAQSGDWVYVAGAEANSNDARRGSADLVPGVDDALTELGRRYNEVKTEGDPHAAAMAAALVSGYLATGYPNTANEYLRDALPRFPKDPELLSAAAAVAYADSRLEECIELLNRVLDLDGGDAVAQENQTRVLHELD